MYTKEGEGWNVFWLCRQPDRTGSTWSVQHVLSALTVAQAGGRSGEWWIEISAFDMGGTPTWNRFG